MNLKLIEFYDHFDDNAEFIGWTVFFRDEDQQRRLICRIPDDALFEPARFTTLTAFDIEGLQQGMLDPVTYETEYIVALVKAAIRADENRES